MFYPIISLYVFSLQPWRPLPNKGSHPNQRNLAINRLWALVLTHRVSLACRLLRTLLDAVARICRFDPRPHLRRSLLWRWMLRVIGCRHRTPRYPKLSLRLRPCIDSLPRATVFKAPASATADLTVPRCSATAALRRASEQAALCSATATFKFIHRSGTAVLIVRSFLSTVFGEPVSDRS